MDIALDEVIHFDAITHHPSTGAVTDADSTPTWSIFEEDTDTAILSAQNFTKRTSLTGNYRGSATLSTANGFEVGKWYNVIGSATVNSIAGKAVVMRFRVVAAETVAGTPNANTTHAAGTAWTSAPQTGDSYAVVSHVTYGLAALKTLIDAVGTIVTAIAAIFSGMTSLPNWLRRLARSDAGSAGMVTAASEIATGGTATYTGTTDNLEAIKDAVGASDCPTVAEIVAALDGSSITIQSPVLSNSEIDIVQNADYYTADGRELEWTITGAAYAGLVTSATLTVASGGSDDVQSFVGTVSLSSGSGSTTFHVTVQIDRATGALLDAGQGMFDLFATLSNGHQVPLVSEGQATVRRRLS